MTTTSEKTEMLAQDTRGRVRVSDERREALLMEFDKSGMSAARFAAWAGVNYQTFAGWVQRRRKARARAGVAVAERPVDLRWVEAVVSDRAAVASSGVLLVHLPGGARIEVSDGQSVVLAAELLRVLSRRASGC